VNDLQNTSKKNIPGKDHSVKIPITDYLLKETNLMIDSGTGANQHHANYIDQLSFISQLVPEHPPEC
jgi:hypothetical protein